MTTDSIVTHAEGVPSAPSSPVPEGEPLPPVLPPKWRAMMCLVMSQLLVLAILVAYFDCVWQLYLVGMHLGNGLAVPLAWLFFAICFAIIASACDITTPSWKTRDDEWVPILSMLLFVSVIIFAPFHGLAANDVQAAQSRVDQVKHPATMANLHELWLQGATAFTLKPEWIRRDTYGASGNRLLLAVSGTGILFGQESQSILTPLSALPLESDGLLWVNQVNSGPFFYALQDFMQRNPQWNATLDTPVVFPNNFKSNLDDTLKKLSEIRIIVYCFSGVSLVWMLFIDFVIYGLLK